MKKSRPKYLIGKDSVADFFRLYFSFYALVAVIGVYTSSYFGFAPTAALSVVVEDGWCNAEKQGIGSHCFGDFYYSLGFVGLPNPWVGSPFPYPPLASAIFKPFLFIFETFPNSSFSLIMYLLVLMLAVMTVPVSIVRKFNLNWQLALQLFVFTFSVTPIIFALDRGNIILLVFPLLYFFLISEIENKHKSSLIYWILMVLIKPQFAILSLLFFRGRQIKRGVKNLLIGFTTFLCSFILYPTSIIQNFISYLKQLLTFQEYAPPGVLYPLNISMGNTLSLVSTLFFDFIPSVQILTYISLLFLAIVAIKTFRSSEVFNIQIAALVILGIILFPITSYGYYLVLVIPLILTAVYVSLGNRFHIEKVNKNTIHVYEGILENTYIRLFLGILLLPWQIPLSLFFDSTDFSTNTAFSFHWILVQIELLVLSGYLIHRPREHKE